MEHSQTVTTRDVRIPVRSAALAGHLTLPLDRPPAGVVIFAHGSGSSRHSSRNRFVAETLQQAHFGTLLFDLLTEAEESVDRIHRHLRFDIGMLAERLTATIDWVAEHDEMADQAIGLFGASTGAAAALRSAAARPDLVHAVVSRGGRPDLAAEALADVHSPTLLLVGEWDEPVIELNEAAQREMTAPCELVIVPRATHLFEEPGALEQVAKRATKWFATHLRSPGR